MQEKEWEGDYLIESRHQSTQQQTQTGKANNTQLMSKSKTNDNIGLSFIYPMSGNKTTQGDNLYDIVGNTVIKHLRPSSPTHVQMLLISVIQAFRFSFLCKLSEIRIFFNLYALTLGIFQQVQAICLLFITSKTHYIKVILKILFKASNI